MGTKIQILEKEIEKLRSERDELKDATLENKVMKNRLAQLDHDYNQVSSKFSTECDSNLSIRAELVQVKQEYQEVLTKFSAYAEEYDKFKRISSRYEELQKSNS